MGATEHLDEKKPYNEDENINVLAEMGPFDVEKARRNIREVADSITSDNLRQDSNPLASHIGDSFEVIGANMGTLSNAKFDMITNHFDYGEYEPYAKQIEDLYLDAYSRCADTTVTPMEVNESNKVSIKPGMLLHRASSGGINLDVLKGISELGIVASEWFGQQESEKEGVCCAFLNTIRDESDNNDPYAKMQNLKLLSLNDNAVNLFLDNTNPVLQELLSADFFRYKKGDIDDMPDRIKSIFENFVAPNSKGMSDRMLRGPLFSGWKAILGGIPPQLINGVQVKTTGENDLLDDDMVQKIEAVTKMFPQATIFDTNLDIIREAKSEGGS